MRRQIVAVKVIICENVSVALYTLGDVDRKISGILTLLGELNFGQACAFMLMTVIFQFEGWCEAHELDAWRRQISHIQNISVISSHK
jgi:hypothetical protein